MVCGECCNETSLGDHFWRNSEQRLIPERYISFTALVAIALVAGAVTLPAAIASVRTAIDAGRITYAGARIDANWSADGRRVAFVENGPDAQALLDLPGTAARIRYVHASSPRNRLLVR